MIIDVHAHFVPPELPDFASRLDDERWPSLEVGEKGGQLIQHGVTYRLVSPTYFDVAARLDDLDRLGIDRQVLSPLPVHLVSWASAGPATEYCSALNEGLAAVSARHPDRFSAFGCVPLQDPARAIAQLAEVRRLGLAGVEIGTSIGTDLTIGDDSVKDFFAAVAEMDLPVLLHPNTAPVFAQPATPPVEVIAGLPCDTARALTSLLLNGTLGDLPNLRVCASHGGGAFLWLWSRLRQILAQSGRTTELPATLHVDTASLSENNVDYLRRLLGDTHILFGTDLPAAADAAVLDGIEVAVNAGPVAAVNALRFLRRPDAYSVA